MGASCSSCWRADVAPVHRGFPAFGGHTGTGRRRCSCVPARSPALERGEARRCRGRPRCPLACPWGQAARLGGWAPQRRGRHLLTCPPLCGPPPPPPRPSAAGHHHHRHTPPTAPPPSCPSPTPSFRRCARCAPPPRRRPAPPPPPTPPPASLLSLLLPPVNDAPAAPPCWLPLLSCAALPRLSVPACNAARACRAWSLPCPAPACAGWRLHLPGPPTCSVPAFRLPCCAAHLVILALFSPVSGRRLHLLGPLPGNWRRRVLRLPHRECGAGRAAAAAAASSSSGSGGRGTGGRGGGSEGGAAARRRWRRRG